jgi:MbtH protein
MNNPHKPLHILERIMNATAYNVVRNDEDQYSVWPAYRPVPAGWTTVGEPADRETCLERIEALWTDMRPRSLRAAKEQ